MFSSIWHFRRGLLCQSVWHYLYSKHSCVYTSMNIRIITKLVRAFAKQLNRFTPLCVPTSEIKPSLVTVWNGCMTSPAVWGPSADSSRLEVQLHWWLCLAKCDSDVQYTLIWYVVSWMWTNFGNIAFSAARPWIWNYLPTDFRQLDLSYSHFRQSLNTLLCGRWDQSTVCTFILSTALQISSCFLFN